MNGAEATLARRNLLAFVKVTMPTYKAGWVHREICARLMHFLADVLDGRSPRLVITMPPRHGKSELVSRRFPAWAFGINPDLSIIAASYSDDLSKRMNKDVQRIMDTPEYSMLFPNSTLSKRRNAGGIDNMPVRTMDLFEIPGHSGSYRSAGVGGGITGMGADILSIDDPFKDRASADSPTLRQRVWDWYASTAYTRLSPGGGVLVTVTRWHEDDLVGRLLAAQGQDGADRWTVVNYPAIAETDELHRDKGEALHPDRYPLPALKRIRANIGEYEWSALYQQHPTPMGGGVFKREWFRFYEPATLPVRFDRIFQSWDFTFKASAHSDNVCGQLWGKKGPDFYLLDCVCDKMTFVESLKAMLLMTERHPEAVAKYVEAKANGEAIMDMVRQKVPGVIPVTPTESKVARAHAVTPLFQAGNVYVPKEAPWVYDYLDELTKFPNAAHDDRVDATTQGLSQNMTEFSLWDVL